MVLMVMGGAMWLSILGTWTLTVWGYTVPDTISLMGTACLGALATYLASLPRTS